MRAERSPFTTDTQLSNMSSDNKRQGTISSARFNLLSSMVGGGSLSLPLAFHQTGNLFMAPIILIITSILAQQSILFLIKAGVYATTSNNREQRANISTVSNNKGTATYENTARAAYGSNARIFAMGLVCACCFFGVVGYAVLLRDMLEPIVDALVIPPEGVGGGPTLARNAAMLFVVLCITPLTTWKNLTALKDVGAASMASVLTVGLIVAYRSIECQLGETNQQSDGSDANANNDTIRAFPLSMKQLLDAVPLFISSYICHFNVLPIHNELRCPTSDRIRQWVRTSLWSATLFYYMIGFTGSLMAKCTSSNQVQGNILLDFDESDPLLLIGRLCLAMTITLAFPMLVIPARDILVRSLVGSRFGRRFNKQSTNQTMSTIPSNNNEEDEGLTTVEFEPMEIAQPRSGGNNLEEPLLVMSGDGLDDDDSSDEFVEDLSISSEQIVSADVDSKSARTVVALLIFWSAATLACSVSSIDVVWDLLGSSFSIMLAFIIPCGSYLKLSGKRFGDVQDGGSEGFQRWAISRTVAWAMLTLFAPLMVVSTINAVYNSFFISE